MYNTFSSLIYTKSNSISRELCRDIINMFELAENKHPGEHGGGNLNTNVKDTTDYNITDAGPEWKDINIVLKKELGYQLTKYIKGFSEAINNLNYSLSNTNNTMVVYSMQVQKYNRGVGKYIMHNDYHCNWKIQKMRQITFIWYLNDVVDGGETEFWSNFRIKPEAGKLVLFPAHWTFPHAGKMPISSDKYIITGWFYSDYITTDHM
jgi:hypothetical protein